MYIGNEINNSSWKLQESKWHNLYHSRWDLLPAERIEKYRIYVLNHPYLLKSLVQLRGQCLGCLCKSEEHCHSHVLVDLVRTRFKDDFFAMTTKGPLYFFKGGFSPLLNCYPASLKVPREEEREEDEDRKKKNKLRHFPLGAFQLYMWKRAMKSQHRKLAKDILKAMSIAKVHAFHKAILNVSMMLEEQIEGMFEILSIKYDQISEKLFTDWPRRGGFPVIPLETLSGDVE